jgi:ATPase family associated with various cellular activities (AAA)/IPT/TIG domain
MDGPSEDSLEHQSDSQGGAAMAGHHQELQQWLCDVCKEKMFLDFNEAVEHEKTCQGPGSVSTATVTQEMESDNCQSKVQETSHVSVHAPLSAVAPPDETKSASVTDPFFAPRSKKETSGDSKPDRSKKIKNEPQVPINPFFAPMTKQNRQNGTKGTQAIESSKKSAGTMAEVSKKSRKKQKRKQSPPKFAPLVLEGDHQAAGPPNDKKKTAKSPKRPSKKAALSTLTTSVEHDLQTTPQLASIFQHKSTKEIVAEQKQAEFQAKREAERQRERERQAKRTALFGGSSSSNNNKNDCGVVAIGSGDSLKRKHVQSGVAEDRPKMHRKSLPLAPRFPVPNHVFQPTNGSTTAPISMMDVLPFGHAFRKKPKPDISSRQSQISNPFVKREEPFRLKSVADLDAVDESTVSPVQRIFQQFLVPPSRNDVNATSSNKDNRLWADKYGMEHGLIGEAAAQTCQQLLEYINHWRKLRKEAMERMAERQRKRKAKFDKAMGRKVTPARKPKRKKKVYGSDEDDDFLDDDEYWDDDEFNSQNTPLCLLLGPPSSGKTALVHHVAKQSLCSVVEINTTEVRSGAALKNAIEEATKSSSLDTMLSSKEIQAKACFFPAKPNSTNRAVIDSEDEGNHDENMVLSSLSKPDRDEASMAIVLIDEVDILFDSDGDSGFWAALTSLVKTAKSPIILTGNLCPPQMCDNSALPFRLFEMKRPTPEECASKILQICRHEGISMHDEVKNAGPGVMQSMLVDAASACKCDLRQLMNEMQLFAACDTMGAPELIKAEPTVKKEKETPRRMWPSIISVDPTQVSMNEYTILTVKGRNFETFKTLIESTGDEDCFFIYIGDQKCLSRVADDETLVVLCPPYNPEKEDGCASFCSRLVKRIVPLTIDCPSLGISKTNAQRSVKSELLVNGKSNFGSKWMSIEYSFPDERSCPKVKESDDNSDEFELDGGHVDQEPTCLADLKMERKEDGLEKWNRFLGKLVLDSPLSQGTHLSLAVKQEIHEASCLQACSSVATLASDAAFLEDFQEGIPFLSGACRGFGFDLTEDCVGYATHGDKLRLHENNRP